VSAHSPVFTSELGKSRLQIPRFARNDKTDNGERIRERGGSSG
jgi:hypothetical protein